jgi:hypothetical protein
MLAVMSFMTGTAMAINVPSIATTNTSSVNENPRSFRELKCTMTPVEQ